MQQTEADAENTDNDYSEAENNKVSAANRDTMLDSTTKDKHSSTYTFAS